MCKKILIVTPDKNAGGSSKSLLPLVDALNVAGYSLLVVGPSSSGFLANSLYARGIEYRSNPFSLLNVWPRHSLLRDKLMFIPRLLRFLLFKPLSQLCLYKTVKKFKPNIIYSNSSAITYGYHVANWLNICHIWHIREYCDKDFNLTFFPSNKTKFKFLKSCPSISITQEINSYYGLQSIGTVIYNGIYSLKELSDNSHKEIGNTKSFFLYIGTISEQKGCTDLIIAYSKYIKKGGMLNLVFCGSFGEDYEKTFTSLLHKYPECYKKIILKGQIKDPRPYMSQAKAIIVPSNYEAFGRVTAEAMFNNCLIIGRNTGGTKEQFDLGLSQNKQEIGLRFESIEELTNQMVKVECMDENSILSLTNVAFKTAINNFTLENYVSSVKEYLDHLIC